VLPIESPKTSSTNSTYSDIHAGDGETAAMSEYYPGLVDLNIAKSLKATQAGSDELGLWIEGGDNAVKITTEGFFGDPAGYEKVNIDYEGLAKLICDSIISTKYNI
jgi:creatinine amidohydrolase/Fe(II)-dependent formamide hydrolase-like protein